MSNLYRRKKHQNIETSEGKHSPIISDKNSVLEEVKEMHVFIGLLIFRLCNISLVQTWFVPDEYWQGPEIAHRMVFGYGHETWEWKEGIRGYTFPLLFAIFFKILQILRIDWPTIVIYLPRVCQAILSATAEFFTYKFAKLVCNAGVAWWVLFCEITSWFVFFCSTRTLTNTMETSFVSIGLYFWQLAQTKSPETNKKHTLYTALILASLSCLVRPTALIIWVPLGIEILLCSKNRLKFVLKYIVPVGVVAGFFSIVLDSLFYGKFVVVQYNFLYFNIMKNIGKIYGTHPWYWYLVQGIPVVLTSHLVPLCIGLYYSTKSLFKWIIIILINIFIYSLLSHKEFRFIMPILPIFMCICGEGLHKIADTTVTSFPCKKHDDKVDQKQVSIKGKLLVMFLLITNIPTALYTGLIHQRGTLDVIKGLEHQLQNYKSEDDINVLFLMPCHSTPYYSYIHRDIKMNFLDCSPSMNTSYVDEADQFYKNPLNWLNKAFHESGQNKSILPTHIVLFDVLINDIDSFLWKHKYTKCDNFFHTHFPSGRIGRQVLIFCKKKEN